MSEPAPEIVPEENLEKSAAVEADEPSAEPVAIEAVGSVTEIVGEDWPMAWHRFLTRFWLWMEAALHVVQAAGLLLGWQYRAPEIREAVYAGLSGMRALDLGMALAAALGALLCVCAAVKLRHCDSAGPRLLRAAYAALLIGQLACAAGRYCIAGLTPLSPSALGQAAVYLALLLVNGSYYRKRRDGFVRRVDQTGGTLE